MWADKGLPMTHRACQSDLWGLRHGWAKSQQKSLLLVLALLFGAQQGKQAAFVLSNLESKASRAELGESRKQKAEKVCFLKVGELWPLPLVAAYESAPSKFTSQPNPTNQTHAPKYRLSESEFTYI